MQQRRMGIASCEDQNHAAEFHVNNLPRHADTPLFQLQSKSSVSFRRKKQRQLAAAQLRHACCDVLPAAQVPIIVDGITCQTALDSR